MENDKEIQNKAKLIVTYLILLLMTFLILSNISCRKDTITPVTIEDTTNVLLDNINVNDDFDWQTTKNIKVNLKVLNSANIPVSNVFIKIYDKNPYPTEITENSTFNQNNAKVLYKGSTNNNGELIANIELALRVENIFACPQYIGVNPLVELTVQNEINYTFGSKQTKSNNKVASSWSKVANNYLTLGTWNSSGLPNYLETTDDNINADFLADVNASLPERDPLPQTHPQYLANGNETNINLIEDAELWVTFVHEGAGWKNVLGYYTYPINNPPTSSSQIDNKTIIFPNVSYEDNTLNSGNKVKLKYYNQTTDEFEDIFPANTTIAWFLIAQGWNNDIVDGLYTVYSQPDFNLESDNNLKQHNVLLKDAARELILLGFEDINRQWGGCDNDFNDAVFYATASPYTAINTDEIEEIDTPTDTDGDGVSDQFDDYPNDEKLAYDNFYPAKDVYNTLVFEDLWPHKGDFDFNDLVLNYNFNQITNADNLIARVDGTLVVKAIGAGFHNGFGFELPILPSAISSVSGTNISQSYISNSSNGTESGQANAVIIAFDNAFDLLPHPGSGSFVNTSIGSPYVIPQELKISFYLSNPIATSNLGTPPYNPFLIVNLERGKEIHLSNHSPTSLADNNYFGTGHDNSNHSTGKYYLTENNLPWALNIAESFDYPIEKTKINEAYLYFTNWAESSGTVYTDWYQDNSNYRNSAKIYSP